jgi:hypothetical protein
MKPGIALMPFASIVFNPDVFAAPRVTDAIFPPRTMIVAESTTVPLPTITRAFVIARSCAAVGAALNAVITTVVNATYTILIGVPPVLAMSGGP